MPFPKNVAVIYDQRPHRPGMGGNVVQALREFCHAEQFAPGKELEGWDHYLYVDRLSPVHRHPSTFWATDMVVPQHRWLRSLKAYLAYAREADSVFAGSQTSTQYLNERGVAARWLPLAANPDYHFPSPNGPIEYDCIALWHHCRNRLEYGPWIKENSLYKGFIGYRDGLDYSRWMSRARCGINIGRTEEMNLRIFEIMAMGVPLITHRANDLDTLFAPGVHYQPFSSPEEMQSRVLWVKNHPQEACKMAQRARAEVLAKHTFRHRVMEIFRRREDGIRN